LSKLPMKLRPSQPSPAVMNSIQAAILELAASYLKSGGFQHKGTKGSKREHQVQRFFKERIPGKFEVGDGEVIDLNEDHSPQLDVMIFNSHNNYAFASGKKLLLRHKS
jgi:hypothetical protein